MKITDTLLIENFTKYEYDKIQMLKRIYIKNMSYLKLNDISKYRQMLSMMTKEERDLMLYGELSDELIERNQTNGTNNDRSFTKEDGTYVIDIWQTSFMLVLQKVVTELDTVFFFKNLGDRFIFKFNPKATKIDGSKQANSEPDFLLIDEELNETYYIEQKALYFGRHNDLKMKKWQYDRLERLIKNGKTVLLLNKVYDENLDVELDLYELNGRTKEDRCWYQYYNDYDYQYVYTTLQPDATFKQDLLATKLVNLVNGEEVEVNLQKNAEPIIIPF